MKKISILALALVASVSTANEFKAPDTNVLYICGDINIRYMENVEKKGGMAISDLKIDNATIKFEWFTSIDIPINKPFLGGSFVGTFTNENTKLIGAPQSIKFNDKEHKCILKDD